MCDEFKEIDRRAGILALAKMAEEKAKEDRIRAEEHLAELIPITKSEGSVTVDTGNFKVTITNSINRSLDGAALESIRSKIPTSVFETAFTYRPAIALPGLRFVQNNEPELYALLSQAITSKPAKPSIKIVNSTQAELAA